MTPHPLRKFPENLSVLVAWVMMIMRMMALTILLLAVHALILGLVVHPATQPPLLQTPETGFVLIL